MQDETKTQAAAPTYSLDPDLIAQRLGSDLVAVHLGNNRIFELNAPAARIFELMRDGCTRDQIAGRISEEFEVDAAAFEEAFDRLVERLRTLGLLR